MLKAISGFLGLHWLKISISVGILLVVWLAWSHYTGLVDEVSDLKIQLSEQEAETKKAVGAAKANQEALERTEAAHQRSLDAVTKHFTDQQKMIEDIAAMDAILDKTPSEENGPMAPVLQQWRPSYE